MRGPRMRGRGACSSFNCLLAALCVLLLLCCAALTALMWAEAPPPGEPLRPSSTRKGAVFNLDPKWVLCCHLVASVGSD